VPSAGTRTGDRLPLFNAACIQCRSDARGRSYRGSKHFAPVSESDTTDDTLTGAGLTNWQTLAAALDPSALFLTGLNGSVWQFVILSPTLSNLTANPSIFTFSTVIANGGTILNAKVGTMKRRKSRGT